MQIIHPNSCGVDIGSKQVFVAISGEPVKIFDTFTEDFERLAEYLLEHQITTIAMEATGVYWGILYAILSEQGLDVWLVDGRQTKQVPGRKTDVKDCQWIQQLHSYGLLNRCFVPDEPVQQLRVYQRLREDHIRSSAMHINHMQKALIRMNIRLPEVLSQIHGSSGMKMIQAILAGETKPEILLKLCHTSIVKHKKEKVLKALKGRYTQSGLFALQQGYAGYHFYQQQILDCDKQIEVLMESIQNQIQRGSPSNIASSTQKKIPRKPIRHNAPQVKKLDDYLLNIFGGKDATDLSGITDYTWLQLYSEIGNDLTRWATEKHFTSWLGLSPKQHQSGKSKKRVKWKGKPKAGQIFRVIAQSIIQSKHLALGAFGRRIRARKGPRVAMKAVARKLAEQYWRFFVKGTEFVERGVADYEHKVRQQKEKTLQRLANELNIKVSYYQ